jgi:hypothetical protein
MPPAEFEHTIPKREPPQIYFFYRAATGASRSGSGVPLILGVGIKVKYTVIFNLRLPGCWEKILRVPFGVLVAALSFPYRAASISYNKRFQQMRLVLYLYFIYILSPYMFRAFLGPSSGVS